MNKILTPGQGGMALPVGSIDPFKMVEDYLDSILAQGVPPGYDYARIAEVHRKARVVIQTLMARSSIAWHLPVVKRVLGETDDKEVVAKIQAALEQIAAQAHE